MKITLLATILAFMATLIAFEICAEDITSSLSSTAKTKQTNTQISNIPLSKAAPTNPIPILSNPATPTSTRTNQTDSNHHVISVASSRSNQCMRQDINCSNNQCIHSESTSAYSECLQNKCKFSGHEKCREGLKEIFDKSHKQH